MQYGGYAPYWRAVKSLEEKYGIKLDKPLAGVLDAGQHEVVLTDVTLATTFIDLVFTSDRGGTHKQRIFRHNKRGLAALKAAGIDPGRPQDSRGQRLVITLDWQPDRYRIVSLPTGMYAAMINGEEAARSTSISDLKRQAEEAGVKQSYLEVIKYEPGHRDSREQLRSDPAHAVPSALPSDSPQS